MCIRDRHLVFRQPFPGPGLGIRIIGEVNAEKVRIVQDADAIYREEVDKAVAAYKKENGKAPSWMPNQYFAALTNMRSVGVMGDERTYDLSLIHIFLESQDFFRMSGIFRDVTLRRMPAHHIYDLKVSQQFQDNLTEAVLKLQWKGCLLYTSQSFQPSNHG